MSNNLDGVKLRPHSLAACQAIERAEASTATLIIRGVVSSEGSTRR